ncbi:MAG TPA: glycosyltransferase family 4 protein, partial [bacterium]|nr:glycosyltransferase family 4 protein [bacterium]
ISLGGIGVDPRQVWGGRGDRFRQKYRISSPIVLQLSKQIIDKGSQHTVEAMKLLWSRGCDATLVLAGQVTENFDTYWFKQPAEVLERTVLMDYVTQEEKKDLLDACDVFVMPSKAESFGLVYCEAWLYKKPVIGAFAGGVPALIEDGKDGFLVPYGDAHFLGETILGLLERPALRQALGEVGYRKTLRDYTWEVQYQNVLRVYEYLTS